jgi:four helix bundle protein
MSTPPPPGPKRLRVYHLALRFVREAEDLLRRTHCAKALADQLSRAAYSIVLNIAEGAAHYQTGHKLNRYRSAHGSAVECQAALQLLAGSSADPRIKHVLKKAEMISIMLVALIRSLENRISAT